MTDSLSPAQRVKTMQAVKSSGTRPELLARRLCRELGMPGYRLNRTDIAGKPDIAFIGRKLAILVHGCFWHRHACKAGTKVPATNLEYWTRKFGRNVERDKSAMNALKGAGWAVLTLWECELANEVTVRRILRDFFRKHGRSETK